MIITGQTNQISSTFLTIVDYNGWGHFAAVRDSRSQSSAKPLFSPLEPGTAFTSAGAIFFFASEPVPAATR